MKPEARRFFRTAEEPFDFGGVTRAWVALAVSALLLSAVYATVLVLVRSGVVRLEGGESALFHRALVLHVNFALVVWFLSASAAAWSGFLPARRGRVAWAEVALAAAGVLLIAVSPLLAGGRPLLHDYLPLLDNPLFLAGLGCFLAGVGSAAVRALAGCSVTEARGGVRLLLGGSALACVLALAGGGLTALRLGGGPELAREVAWSLGHGLQISHLLLLMFSVRFFFTPGAARATRGASLRDLAVYVILACAVVGASIPLLGAAAGARGVYTTLMEISGTLGFFWLVALWREEHVGRHPGRNSGQSLRAAGVMAPALFGLAVVLGFSIRENDALVPAHYHAAIGSVTLGLMILLLEMSHRGVGSPLTKRLVDGLGGLYAGGVILLVAGLLVSDLPRKSAEAALSGVGEGLIGRVLVGMGGAALATATLLFVAAACRALLAPAPCSRELQGALTSRGRCNVR